MKRFAPTSRWIAVPVPLAACGEGSNSPNNDNGDPTGTLAITTTTTGSSIDPSYSLLLDAVVAGPLGSNTTRVLSNLAIGGYHGYREQL